jgi:hypothetical protein
MPIDYDAILDKFVVVAQQALPTQLSLIGVNGNTPAVIRARQTGPKPNYPYVTVDAIDTMDESGWLLEESIDVNDDTVYQTTKQILIVYRVYGGNAISLGNTLQGFFRVSRILGDIRNTLGGSVVTVDDVDSLPILLENTYLESSALNLTFNIIDTFVDTTGSSNFTTINLDGLIYDGGPEDPDPLVVDITVPIP